jgi:hypothetical protein
MGRHSRSAILRSEACAPSSKQSAVVSLQQSFIACENKSLQIPGSRQKLYVEGEHPLGPSQRAIKTICISGIFLTIKQLPIRDKSATDRQESSLEAAAFLEEAEFMAV